MYINSRNTILLPVVPAHLDNVILNSQTDEFKENSLNDNNKQSILPSTNVVNNTTPQTPRMDYYINNSIIDEQILRLQQMKSCMKNIESPVLLPIPPSSGACTDTTSISALTATTTPSLVPYKVTNSAATLSAATLSPLYRLPSPSSSSSLIQRKQMYPISLYDDDIKNKTIVGPGQSTSFIPNSIGYNNTISEGDNNSFYNVNKSGIIYTDDTEIIQRMTGSSNIITKSGIYGDSCRPTETIQPVASGNNIIASNITNTTQSFSLPLTTEKSSTIQPQTFAATTMLPVSSIIVGGNGGGVSNRINNKVLYPQNYSNIIDQRQYQSQQQHNNILPIQSNGIYKNPNNNIPNYNQMGIQHRPNNFVPVVDGNLTTYIAKNDGSCSNTGIFEKENTISNPNQSLYDEQKYKNRCIQLQQQKQFQQQQQYDNNLRHEFQDNNYSTIYPQPQWSPYSLNQERINMNIKEKNDLILKQDLLIQQQNNILMNGDLLCYNLLGPKSFEYKHREQYQTQYQQNKPSTGYFTPLENNMIPQMSLNENSGGCKNVLNHYSSPPLPPPPSEVKKLITKEITSSSVVKESSSSSSSTLTVLQQQQKEEFLQKQKDCCSSLSPRDTVCSSSLSTTSSSSSSLSSTTTSIDNEVAKLCGNGQDDEDEQENDKNVEKLEKEKENCVEPAVLVDKDKVKEENKYITVCKKKKKNNKNKSTSKVVESVENNGKSIKNIKEEFSALDAANSLKSSTKSGKIETADKNNEVKIKTTKSSTMSTTTTSTTTTTVTTTTTSGTSKNSVNTNTKNDKQPVVAITDSGETGVLKKTSSADANNVNGVVKKTDKEIRFEWKEKIVGSLLSKKSIKIIFLEIYVLSSVVLQVAASTINTALDLSGIPYNCKTWKNESYKQLSSTFLKKQNFLSMFSKYSTNEVPITPNKLLRYIILNCPSIPIITSSNFGELYSNKKDKFLNSIVCFDNFGKQCNKCDTYAGIIVNKKNTSTKHLLCMHHGLEYMVQYIDNQNNINEYTIKLYHPYFVSISATIDRVTVSCYNMDNSINHHNNITKQIKNRCVEWSPLFRFNVPKSIEKETLNNSTYFTTRVSYLNNARKSIIDCNHGEYTNGHNSQSMAALYSSKCLLQALADQPYEIVGDVPPSEEDLPFFWN